MLRDQIFIGVLIQAVPILVIRSRLRRVLRERIVTLAHRRTLSVVGVPFGRRIGMQGEEVVGIRIGGCVE